MDWLMNRSILDLPFLTCVLAFFLFASNGAKATENRAEVERLIAEGQWSKAAKQVYLEARNTYKHELSIAVGQAQSGYIDDALETIELSRPSTYKLISVLRAATNISESKKLELTKKAIVYAKERPKSKAHHYLLSNDLIAISLYYSSLGLEENSRILFNEAMSAAEKGLMEEGRGYQAITSRMSIANQKEIRPWMFFPLQLHLNMLHSPELNAYACIDMISVSQRALDPTVVTPFIKCASSSISRVNIAPLKKRLLNKLSEVKARFGLASREKQSSPLAKALQYSRAGHLAEAYSVISSMKQNLYVDHKWALYKQVFSDAIDRGDIKAALYFAERPARELSSQSLAIWQRVAEKQIESGSFKAGYSSYETGVGLLSKLSKEPRAYSFTIQRASGFGGSMIRNNMVKEGRRVLQLAQSLQRKIPIKAQEDRVEAALYIAITMLRLDLKPEGKPLLLKAYQNASSFDTSRLHGDMKKASLLSSIAHALSDYATEK